MSLLRALSLRPERRSTDYLDPTKEIWSRRRGTSTVGAVTEDKASTLMAVWRCQNLLADIVAGLPIHEYRNDSSGVRQRVTPSPFVRRPSQFVRPKEWRYQLMMSALTHGNAYPFVTEITPSGRVQFAEIVAPGDMQVERRDGALAPPVYKLKGQVVDPGRVLHMRAFGPVPGSVLGLSPLAYAAHTIKLGIGARDQMLKWHDKGGHPTAVLSNETDLTSEQATTAKSRYREGVEGDDLVVLGGSWSLDAAQLAPDDTSFNMAKNSSAVDICGYYGVPPEMIGLSESGSSVTYANREQRALDLLVYTVQWWIGRVEDLITEQLPDGRYVKLNLDALLRSDALTRWKIHDTAIRVGARSPDEAREFEDQAPIEGGTGDTFLWPPYSTTPVPQETQQ